MSRKRLTADDLRHVEEGTHLVLDLHDDEYWEGAEGHVQFVKEYPSGNVHVGVTPLSGPQHPNRLKIPADAREGLRYSGGALGADNLRVTAVHEKTTCTEYA